MTAEALSATEADVAPRSAAADGPPRSSTDGDSAPDAGPDAAPDAASDAGPELAEARQSVVDVVAARLEQVAAPDGAGVNGQHADGPPADGPHAEGGLAEVAPADGVRDGGTDPAGAAADGPERPGDAPSGEAPEGGTPEGAAPEGLAADGSAELPPALEPAGDAARFAASAVLDVLRASGWADAGEAQRLRAEADRLRELLDLVVRDHRAREASAAGVENQQHHWLIPLLRAAHGVAFGSLGAKVALRTAVQDVPEQILASAGLRIDYGVENTGEPAEER